MPHRSVIDVLISARWLFVAQTTTGLSGFMARPQTKGWSLEDEGDEDEAQPAAMSAAAAVAAAINRSFMITPADQKDKETPGYGERMEVADDVDPLDAFMSTLQKGAPVVEQSSTYGALGAGDDVMQQNGRKFDPVGSMVITAADLIGGECIWVTAARLKLKLQVTIKPNSSHHRDILIS